MANRPIRRKVTIVFEGRDPNDPARLLKAVADELRPREVEIRVKSQAPDNDPPTLANEPLETQAREHAEQVLDRRDRQIRSGQEAATTSADPAADLTKRRSRVRAMLGRLVAGGWRITLKVLPVAERVARIVKELSG